ncbi:MAG: carbonic anhydrase [Humidesulfovibrio sp.]|uniref:carbonic anhydrase n=1 Tax=Humidesulfovibrio sp. TaxID=2910988 RepID=UPI002734CEE3|nr:carbonic anhydrase [Humidesulfovibrio sp.]MDP2848151.1 carbonic anhydrase [Humidesulfovibrio sp.]
MKKWFAFCALILGLSASALASSGGSMLPADEAMQLLKDGNARYVAGNSTHSHQGLDRRAETAKGGQHPIATIVGCSDSRAPLEVLFDQGVGDIFVIRVAGNLAGADELGSVEYGVGHLGTPVVLVLGHTACGAVTAAVQNAKVHGNIPALIDQIKPAVARAKTWSPTASGDDLLNKSIKANVWLTMENILRKSQEVREFVASGKVLLVGGIYDLNSGQVAWIGQHPEQGKLLTVPMQAKSKPKPKAKAKPKVEPEAKADDQGDTKPEAEKAGAAKPAAKPDSKSDGAGELLAPTPEKAPAKAVKGAHQ